MRLHREGLKLMLWVCLIVLPFNALYAQKTTREDSLICTVTIAKSDTQKVNALLQLCRFYRQEVVTKEFYYATEALGISEKMGWEEGKMYAEELIGECYITVLSYDDAIVHFKKGIIASKKVNRQDVERVCLQYMVHCYHQLNKLNQATDCQKFLLDMTALAGDKLGECNQMSAYAQFLGYCGRYSEGISYMFKDIELTKARFNGKQQTEMVADWYNTLSTIYLKTYQLDSALYCLRISEILAKRVNNVNLSAYVMSSFCDVFIAQKQYDSAIIYGERAIKLATDVNNLVLQQLYYDTLSQLYEYKQKPLAALAAYRKFDSLNVITNATQKTINEAMAVTKINMEQQAALNKSEKRSLEAVRRNQQAALVAVLVALVALVILTIFIYRNLRQKLRANKIIGLQAASLQKQNKVIDSALKEKEMLLQETHHRVKNNLQLISSLLELQTADITDENAKAALRTAQRRVQSIATVHNKLYNSGENEAIEFSAFINDLFASLSGAFSSDNKRVKFHNNIPATFFGLNTLVPLGLILNELITNSFKHAFTDAEEGLINIQLQTKGDEYVLRYYDNGPGMPGGKFDTDSGSLGLYLVKRLSKQLKGKATYNFSGGSIFTIIFHDAAAN